MYLPIFSYRNLQKKYSTKQNKINDNYYFILNAEAAKFYNFVFFDP